MLDLFHALGDAGSVLPGSVPIATSFGLADATVGSLRPNAAASPPVWQSDGFCWRKRL
jgi:hypothetical protein